MTTDTMNLSKRPGDTLIDTTYGKRARIDDVSEEVAGDFKDSLSDLSNNDRYQISTLTIIAKENTEHARAISDVLRKHIRDVPPTRKLPALYVLDSIVKNVGTPYTLFLSQDLFQTFFDAYTVVDDATRKQMESMLKTWKEPIPGSLEQKAVFPIDATRRIETALIKARTAFIEQQKTTQSPLHHHQMSRPSSNVHALPPRPNQGINPVIMNALQNSQYPQSFHHLQQQLPENQYGLHTSSQNGGYQNQVSAVSGAAEGNIHEFNISNKSSTPVYAQGIYSQPPPPQIRSPPPYQSSYQPPPTRSPQQNFAFPPLPQQFQHSQPTPSQLSQWLPPPVPNGPAPPPPSATQLSILLQLQGHLPGSVPQQQSQYQPPPLPPQQSFHYPPPIPPPPHITDLAALLKAAQSGNTPTQPFPAFPPPHLAPPPSITPSLGPSNNTSYATPNMASASLATPSPQKPMTNNDVTLSSMSLKIPRPHLIPTLYPTGLGSQCTTCGRRFPIMTTEGKTRKTHHLDAHFRTNMRLTAALESRTGTHVAQRSWFIDEAEWIAYREVDDADPESADKNSNNGPSLGDQVKKEASQEKFIPAPIDPTTRKAPCPICQEEFETVWHDGAQEWVWMDAVKVLVDGGGERIFHSTCLDMMAKDAR